MISTASSHKPTKKVSSDSAALSFDLLSNLTYMAALAVAMTGRDKIFELSMGQSFRTAVYFKQVYLLTKRLGFEYSRAFQVVAKRAGADTVRALLLRFASSISSGESELGFLSQEARVEREVYTSTYQRRLDTLQKWSDAYAALLVSVSVIVVVAMISTMLYDMGAAFVFLLSSTTIMVNVMGAWIILKAAPSESTAYRSGSGPAARRWAIRLFYITTPLGLAAAAYLTMLLGPGGAFLGLGAAWLPTAVLSYVDDMTVNKLDQTVASFTRAMGNVAGSLGSTLTHALGKLDRRSMGPLEPYIQRLQGRLNAGLSPAVCWERFRDEAGSELVNRTVRMLVDGVELGGAADQVGEIAGDYARGVSLLRDKRQATASTFSFLSFPLHAAMTGLLVFILEVMRSFNLRIEEISRELLDKLSSGSRFAIPSLPVFEAQDLTTIGYLILTVVTAMTIANSLAPQFATGGHPIKTVFYASIMCLLSGGALVGLPPLAGLVLNR